MTRIYPFQTQAVRDLAWACFSPPLLDLATPGKGSNGVLPCSPELTTARRLWLEQLDRDASRLEARVSLPPTHRLGVYFERLWQFFLEHDPLTELVASNLPVRHAGRTLGEFDIIYFCHRRHTHVHLELTVKYFLAAPVGETGATRWLGPDSRDRLDLKLAHLLERQSRLAETAAARALLADRGIEVTCREAAFRGYLFRAVGSGMIVPPGHNPACPIQDWLPVDRLDRYVAGKAAAAYTVLPRLRWLSAARAAAADALNPAGLLEHCTHLLGDGGYPLLVAALHTDGSEMNRFFVTPANWPGLSD